MRKRLFLSTPLLMAIFLPALGCETLNDTTRDFSRFSSRLFENVSGKTPRDAAVKMEDQYSADQRREGINALAARDFGRRGAYIKRYDQIAKLDDDWLVRATAVRALNRSRARDETPIYVQFLTDKNDQVRLEAIKALVHMPDDNAVAPLAKIVQDETDNHDVRVAAAEALHHYRSLEVARALTNTLSGRDFGVAWQSHKSLIYLTGQDLRYDEAAWLAYLTGPQKPFG